MYRLNDDSDADSGSKLQSDTDRGTLLFLLAYMPSANIGDACWYRSWHVMLSRLWLLLQTRCDNVI